MKDPKKKKKLKISTLKRKLDNNFSQYIRLRDCLKNILYLKCISCGKMIYWKDAHCGHFVNRVNMSLRYSEKNCNAQCPKCNTFDEGNVAGYVLGLQRKYGINIVEQLYHTKNKFKKYAAYEYEALIEHYKKEVDKLKKDKGIA